MLKPAFVFDGRNIPDAESLKEIGFVFKSIGKSKYLPVIYANHSITAPSRKVGVAKN